jgi:hypothetical protein
LLIEFHWLCGCIEGKSMENNARKKIDVIC